MLAYKTPEQRINQYVDNGTSLVIVHANSQHDPDKVSKRPIQKLIESNIVDYIYEFMAFHESFIRHDGIIIDNNRKHGEYHIDDLAGNNYIVVGGGLGNCHFGVYSSLLASRFTRKTTIHLPTDSIYRTYEDYEGGDSFLTSELVDLTAKEFKRYQTLAKTISEGYELRKENRVVSSSGDKKLQLMLWSTAEKMVQYLAANSQKIQNKV